MPSGTNLLFTVVDGNQRVVYRDFRTTSSLTLTGLPYFENLGDYYSVLVTASDYAQAGFYPVKVSPQAPAVVDLMLLRNNAAFNFKNAHWGLLRQTHPQYAGLLGAGADSESAAELRYQELMETQPAVLACYFNLVTAMSQIRLPQGASLDFLRELVWDNSSGQGMKQDRFFAWARRALVDQVNQAATLNEFTPEPGGVFFHAGASRQWKHVESGEVNLQLTFYENQRRIIGGVDCLIVEPAFDYYKDLAAHAILEVIANSVTQSLTDPRQAYVLRWIAGRQAGLPDFDPPYFLE